MSLSYIPEGQKDASVLPLLHHNLGILKTEQGCVWKFQAKVPLPPEALHWGAIQGTLDTRAKNYKALLHYFS